MVTPAPNPRPPVSAPTPPSTPPQPPNDPEIGQTTSSPGELGSW